MLQRITHDVTPLSLGVAAIPVEHLLKVLIEPNGHGISHV